MKDTVSANEQIMSDLLENSSSTADISIDILDARWLKKYVTDKLKYHDKHKIAFADTREMIDAYIAQKSDDGEEIDTTDLDEICAKTPYIAAIVDDETGEITDYEGITAAKTDANFKARMKQNKGMIIIGA